MFREQIRKHYDHLSRSYRRVADFILSDYRTAAFMTAAALADAVDVDTTTVVRFAQRLGYPGFPELIEDIQGQVKLELSQAYATPALEEGLHAQVQTLIAKDRTHLEKTLAHNTLQSLENVLDLLRAAPRIVVAGESYATPLAQSFAAMLKDAGLPASYVGGDPYERAGALAHLVRKNDARFAPGGCDAISVANSATGEVAVRGEQRVSPGQVTTNSDGSLVATLSSNNAWFVGLLAWQVESASWATAYFENHGNLGAGGDIAISPDDSTLLLAWADSKIAKYRLATVTLDGLGPVVGTAQMLNDAGHQLPTVASAIEYTADSRTASLSATMVWYTHWMSTACSGSVRPLHTITCVHTRKRPLATDIRYPESGRDNARRKHK